MLLSVEIDRNRPRSSMRLPPQRSPSSSAPSLLLFVKSERDGRGGGEGVHGNYGVSRIGSSRDNTRHRINVGAAGNSHLIITGRMLTHRIR